MRASLSLLVKIASDSEFFVHESAVVDQPCQIGKGTSIWHFCHVMKNSSIGDDCILRPERFRGSNVVIGNHYHSRSKA